MTLQEHLEELEGKHKALDKELEEALAHPSTDATEIAELKRKKLQLKDEMQRIRSEVAKESS